MAEFIVELARSHGKTELIEAQLFSHEEYNIWLDEALYFSPAQEKLILAFAARKKNDLASAAQISCRGPIRKIERLSP